MIRELQIRIIVDLFCPVICESSFNEIFFLFWLNTFKILKENINQEEVDKIKNELESVGAKVQII